MTSNEEHINIPGLTNTAGMPNPFSKDEVPVTNNKDEPELLGFLLWEDGGRIMLEDGSGFILLENS
ncbi:MAG: hypothetical protein QM594_02535 [Niabella sp.]